MRKLFSCILFVFMGLMLVSCSNDVQTNYTEYHLGQQMINFTSYYKVDSFEELTNLNVNYLGFSDIYDKYNESYFVDSSLFVFMISESSGGDRHKLDYKEITDDGTLVIKYKLTNVGATCDMAYWHVFFELSKEQAKSVNKIEIRSNKYSSYYNDINNFETAYPEVMPDNIRLFISVYNGINFSYDSSTNELRESYSNKVEYVLSNESFSEIYELLRNFKFDSYPESLYVSDDGKYQVTLSLKFQDVGGYCRICNIPSYDAADWERHKDLGNVLCTILNEYFINTDEYKEIVEKVNE